MSAWIVTHNHIDTLVYWGIARGLIPADGADSAGHALWSENIASVAYRYPADRSGHRPGPLGFEDEEALTYSYAAPTQNDEGDPYDAASAVRLVESYGYQSCEHPQWPESWAYYYHNRLRASLLTVPGIDKALASDNLPWGI